MRAGETEDARESFEFEESDAFIPFLDDEPSNEAGTDAKDDSEPPIQQLSLF